MSPFFFVNRRRKRKRNVRGWEGGKERERERVSNVMVLIVSSTIYLPRYTTNLVCIHYRWLVGSTSSILNLSIFFCPCYTCCLCVCLCLWNFFFRSIILHATHKFHHTFHAIYFTTGSFKVRSFVQKKILWIFFQIHYEWINQITIYIVNEQQVLSTYNIHTLINVDNIKNQQYESYDDDGHDDDHVS